MSASSGPTVQSGVLHAGARQRALKSARTAADTANERGEPWPCRLFACGNVLPPRLTHITILSANFPLRPAFPPFQAFGIALALIPVSHFSGGRSTMPMNLDAYLGVHQDALKIRGQRTEVLARNLANADTPGYQARDLDFRAALAQASGAAGADAPVALKTTSTHHIATSDANGADANPNLKYRVPLAPALDGNTVDVQMEQANFAENAVRFQATLSFLSARFRGLMTAITGQ
jgi:flagellar basal-body rod protein FlgB